VLILPAVPIIDSCQGTKLLKSNMIYQEDAKEV